LWGGAQTAERATVLQEGDNFKAEVFVPVWTSELFVSDWWQPDAMPLDVSIQRQEQGWLVRVDNHTDQKLKNLHLVIEDRIFNLGQLSEKQSMTNTLTKTQGMSLRNFVSTYGSDFQGRISSRQQALGATERGQILDKPNCSVAVSFLSELSSQQNYQNSFISPPGLDLAPAVQHGGAVLLAWSADYSPVKAMHQ